MTVLADLLVRIGVDAEDLDEGTEEAATGMERHLDKVTAAGAAGGAALEAFSRSTATTNAALETAALQTDLTSDEIRDLAGEISTTHGGAEDMAVGLAALADAGVTTREEMESVSPVLDQLAIATGTDLPDAIGTAEDVLGPLGISLEDVADEGDALWAVLDQADGSVGRLNRVLNRTPDELQGMEFGLEDVSAGIQVFEDRGFSANRAIKQFEGALKDSEGDMDTFLGALGLTTDEWDEYVNAAEPVPGSLDEVSDAADENQTFLQNLQGRVEDLMFAMGGWGEAAGMIAPALMALGPIMQGIIGITWLWNSALLANPITWIVLAIAALVAAIVLIATQTTWFQDIWSWAMESIGTAWDWVWNLITSGIDFLTDLFMNWTGPGLLIKHWDTITGAVSTAIAKVRSAVNAMVSWISDRIDDLADLPGKIVEWFSDIGSDISEPLIEGFKDGLNWIIDRWNSLSWTLPSVNIPGVGEVGGGTISTPNIPRLADGGIVPATPGGMLALVGEGGQDEAVIPLDRLDSMLGTVAGPVARAGDDGSGRELTIRLEGDRDLVRMLRRGIRDRGGDVRVLGQGV